MTAFAPFGGGYNSGHPWYYRLGGEILTVEQIKTKASDGRTIPHFVQMYYAKLDMMEEPKRSASIQQEIDALERGLRKDVARYLECVTEINRLRTVCGPEPYDWIKQTYNEPTTSISLKHNHISYCAAKITALKSLKRQGDLFG